MINLIIVYAAIFLKCAIRTTAVTVTEPKPKTSSFSEPQRTETEVFWSHVSCFNQGNFGHVV